ncbi:MAG: alpha/beta hydrolase [Candidatus Pacebacteria bacterium]|nr:alpha/beta hydrolase [Candidatus Paceibacterota bacterium]
MAKSKIKKYFVESAGKKVFVQVEYPSKVPAPAIIVGHGLRSYYTGFLNIFAKKLRDEGYISVKFHFIGTGKSEGLFEEKSTATMVQNFKDVIAYLKTLPEITDIGVMGRSNAGSLAALAGPIERVKSYVLLGSPAFYSLNMKKFLEMADTTKGEYFYHSSFKRKHTKGEGRLPLSFLEEIGTFDKRLLEGIKKLKNVCLLQSKVDEAVPVEEGHFDYWKENLPKPNWTKIMEKGKNHSFKGCKAEVYQDAITWFRKTLPIR